MGRKVSDTMTLAQMPYAPPGGYRLDLEVMTTDELLRRADRRQLCAPHRLDFMSMIIVDAGHCRHMVDFVPYDCHARSWLMVRPGQVHRYDFSSRWRGWQCVFRPEFLLPRRRDRHC